MKTRAKIFRMWFPALPATILLGSMNSGLAGAEISVSPTVVNNVYRGFITPSNTGFSSGETIKALAYPDLNNNGEADAGERLINSFSVTDNGKNDILGTIENYNVPIDCNPATGAITTTLSLAPLMENVAGQRIYHVVGYPPVAFTPVAFPGGVQLVNTNVSACVDYSMEIMRPKTDIHFCLRIRKPDNGTNYVLEKLPR